jgi:hypothetical protein
MEIQFVSTLTPDDEDRIVAPLLSAITAVLDQLPLSYAIRIQTSGIQVVQHAHPQVEDGKLPGSRRQAALVSGRGSGNPQTFS